MNHIKLTLKSGKKWFFNMDKVLNFGRENGEDGRFMRTVIHQGPRAPDYVNETPEQIVDILAGHEKHTRKIDHQDEACQKCPWKEYATTLAGASWRLRQWYQCCDDEEEGQVEHLRDLAKWACDKIRELQSLDQEAQVKSRSRTINTEREDGIDFKPDAELDEYYRTAKFFDKKDMEDV